MLEILRPRRRELLGLTRVGRDKLLGIGALLVSVAIWANFLVTTGGAVGAGLGVVELGLLRGACCAIPLLPVAWRVGLLPRGVGPVRFAVMVLGAGVSFMFLMPFGFRLAPAADSGVFAPGALPLWAAILSVLVLGERISPFRLGGFAMIALGVLAVGGLDAATGAQGGVWLGYLCYSSASFMFACYAVAQRGSGLTAIEATAVISVWSLVIATGVALVFGVDYSALPPLQLAWAGAAQFLSGVVAVATYTYGIIKLGPWRGSAFVALTPAIVTAASELALGQPATELTWIGVAVVSAGVLIASGVFERRPAPLTPA